MYKYQTLKSYVQKTPKIKNRIAQVLHRGSSGQKAKMWKATKTVVGLLAERFPKRFKGLGIREARQKLVNELVGV